MPQLDTYEIDSVFGCWLWRGAVGSNGRPIIWRGKRPSSAHKVAYELQLGPVPAERVLDHLCRRPLCVNVGHLEPVSKPENERRKHWAYRFRRKHCPAGHEMIDCMVTPEGGRLCRRCKATA